MTDTDFFRCWGNWPSNLFAEIVQRKEYPKFVKVHGLTGMLKMLGNLVSYYSSIDEFGKCIRIQTLQLGIKMEFKNKTVNPELLNEFAKINSEPRY